MRFKVDKIIELANQAVRMRPYECDGRFPPSPYYSFFYLLANQFFKKSSLAVVLGVCGGGCCYHFARGNPDGLTIGIDIAQERRENIDYIQDTCPNFKFILSDSTDWGRKRYKEFGPIDFLFIDTVHNYAQTLKEYEAYKSYMERDSVIIMDDLFRPGMEDAFNSINKTKVRLDFLHPGGKIDDEHGDGGFGVILPGETARRDLEKV